MPTSSSQDNPLDRWNRISSEWQVEYPHMSGWLFNRTDFGELRLKARDDGTVLAIAKGFDASGGPVVAFGVGYDVILALMALDSTIQGGHWRIDKPWQPSGK